MAELETIKQKIEISLVNTGEKIAEMGQQIGGLGGVLTRTGKAVSVLKKSLGIGIAVKSVQEASKSYSDMYYSVAKMKTLMGDLQNVYDSDGMTSYYQKAINFQDEMNSKLAIAKSELENYQSMFYKMYEAQGVDQKTSYNLSENLTKMGYDLSQVYFGGDTSSAMSALKSGISGQVKTLRKYGIDVSETSLNSTLQSLGVDKTTEQLNYAEKEMVRYIAIMNQAKDAQGAFAKSTESPIVQLQMLKSSFTELKQTASAFIMKAFSGVIVYLTAIVQVIKEVLQAIADIFGLSLDIGTIDLGDSTGIDDYSSGIADATSNAKELKKQLMGFDEINNISPPTSSSSGSGGTSSAGTIDSGILSGLKDWDNMLDSIKDKTSEIKQKIWDWFKIDDKIKFLKEHFDAIKSLVKDIGVALLLWTVSSAVSKFIGTLLGMSSAGIAQLSLGLGLSIAGIYLMYKGMKKLIDGDFDIVNVFEALGGGAMAGTGLTALIAKAKFGGKFSWKSAEIGFGIVASIASFMVAYNGIKKLIKGDTSMVSLLETLMGTAGGVYGVVNILKTTEKGGVLKGHELSIAFGISLLITGITTNWANGTNGGDDLGSIIASDLSGLGGGAFIGGALGSIIPRIRNSFGCRNRCRNRLWNI